MNHVRCTLGANGIAARPHIGPESRLSAYANLVLSTTRNVRCADKYALKTMPATRIENASE